MELTSRDLYEIRTSGIISDYDRKILTRLYQPLIGFGALSLYLTLWSELEGDRIISMKWNHDRLFKIMDISNSQFLIFRRILEGIGLLATFCSNKENNNEYIYQLFSPLSPEKFFKNKIYDNLLLTRLGDLDYETTKFYFKKNKIIDDIPNISANFNDIFKFNGNQLNSKDQFETVSHIDNEVKINFDIEALLKLIDDYMVPKSVFTASLKLEIATLATIYNLTPIEMKDLVQTSYSFENRKFDLKTLKNRILEYIKINPKELEEINDQEIINTLSPIEFLKYKHHGKIVPNADNRKIEKLIIETGLTYPVINTIIEYVLNKHQNKLYNSALEELAGTFIREKIKSSEEAYEYLYKDKKMKSDDVKEELTKEDEEKIKELMKEFI